MKPPSENLPPQNLDAERSVLGCLILESESINKIVDTFHANQFYSDIHGKIYSACLAIHEKGIPIDHLTIADELDKRGQFEEIGGVPYLREILEAVPHSAHVAFYAEIVSEKYRRRKAIEIGQLMIARAYDPVKSDQEFIEDAHDAAMKMAEMLQITKSRPRPLSDHVDEMVGSLRRGEVPAMFWGIPEIDAMIGGVVPGELVVVGARPSHGKSAVALQWLDEVSRKGVSSLMISEEMVAQNLAARTLTYMTSVPVDDWRKEVDGIDAEVKIHFANRAPVLIAEKCSTIGRIERTIDRAVHSHGVRVVAVDYAQLVDGDGDTKEQRVSNVSSRLKQIATKHEIIVILLAQLNRGVETRDDLTPKSADLKDSGGLEADADIVLLPYLPSMFDAEYKFKNEYRIICSKNRSRSGRGEVIEMLADFKRQRILPPSMDDGRVYTDADEGRFWK